jgi:hypothetical protein
MCRAALALLVAAPLLASPIAKAQEDMLTDSTSAPPVRAVVELFTSQGCSSCPPADALLKSYADSKDIMAISLPIDYWDYIGWKDTFASPRNTERQRAYAQNFGIGPVYTPQVVVNGMAQVLGSSREDIDNAIENTAAQLASRRVPVRFWNQSNSIIIQTGGAPPGVDVKEATIWLAVLRKSADVSIKRGENGGKTLTYYNIVREMTPVGLWKGKPMTLQLARMAIMRPETEESLVLLQEADNGPIIGAAWLGQ